MSASSTFTIYDASAGSGKTFKLTEKYLSLLLKSPKNNAFQNILAITFTNKAVAEMKHRIVDNLVDFSKINKEDDHNPMLIEVQKNTGLHFEEIQKKSKAILRELLVNYAAFEVSTIDAFTHRIIRTFAKDLGLSMNFDIEMDTEQILELAVERVVDRAGTDELLTEILVDFALEKVNDDKSGNISLDIFEASKLILNEKDEPFLAAFQDFDLEDFKSTKNKIRKHTETIENDLAKIGNDFLQKLSTQQIEYKHYTRGSIPKYFDKLKQKDFNIKFDAKWQAEIEDENTHVTKKLDEDLKMLIFALKDTVVRNFYESRILLQQFNFYNKIYKNITQLSLVSAVKDEIENIKTERNILLISDFNKKISNEIKKQPAPFIFERLGEKFQHYFIDEFQDTSRRQWDNLIPLLENALASIFDDQNPGTLTLVGDAKQSIYAWRGGDALQFIDLSDGKSPFAISSNLKILETNYRSSHTVVEFNNAFFNLIGEQLSYDKLKNLFSGKSVSQEIARESQGFVNIKFLDVENNEDRDEAYPEEVFNIIQQKRIQGFQLGDICVLVRKKDQGVAVAKYLNEQDIPIISSETLLIQSDEKVQFLVNLMQAIDLEQDNEAKLKIADYLLSKKEDLEDNRFLKLQQILKVSSTGFWEEIRKLDYDFRIEHFHALPLYDAIEYALSTFQFSNNANAYLQFFLDEVFAFTQKKQGDLSSFLKYWEVQSQKKSIVAPESKNAVQIMTIHKSKGLQFPVVIFPYAKEQTDYTNNSHFWVKLPSEFKLPFGLVTKPSKNIETEDYKLEYESLLKNLEMESINMLYVALTRASEEMFILSEDDRNKDGKIKPTTYCGLLMMYLEHKNLPIETDRNYEFGKSSVPEYKTEETQSQNLKIHFHPKSKNLNVDLVTTAGKIWQDSNTDALQKGNMMHSVLAEIQTESDIQKSIQKHIDLGLVEISENENIEIMLQNIVHHPDLKNYYGQSWEVLNERDISYSGEIIRPDRVCLKGEQAVIIDYKTGESSDFHKFQIELYAEALEDLGYKVQKKILVYINENIDVKFV
ncbi:MAG: UvrD-helicase domain-containing protein [Psychroflexus sp.]